MSTITIKRKSLIIFSALLSLFCLQQPAVFASGTMSKDEINNVERVDAKSEDDKKRLSEAAGLLAQYEIASKKLISDLDSKNASSENIQSQATKLLNLSEDVISSAQFRLPQCKEYLEKTLVLKDQLQTISHDSIEKDFHHDGALPKAPAECYHTKDLFVHPATVIVLTRDDPSLNDATKESINDEITEVLAHTELVRQLVIY
ncbi:MAG: hypothetical protein ACPHLK_07115 [Gammaproteobacteria bacterium]|jgi:hypothetical protein